MVTKALGSPPLHLTVTPWERVRLLPSWSILSRVQSLGRVTLPVNALPLVVCFGPIPLRASVSDTRAWRKYGGQGWLSQSAGSSPAAPMPLASITSVYPPPRIRINLSRPARGRTRPSTAIVRAGTTHSEMSAASPTHRRFSARPVHGSLRDTRFKLEIHACGSDDLSSGIVKRHGYIELVLLFLDEWPVRFHGREFIPVALLANFGQILPQQDSESSTSSYG
jgi:hypothetical protein